jgi:hypothetical protein
MAADLAAHDVSAVIFVDAAMGIPLLPLDAVRIRQVALAAVSPSLGHHFGPSALLAYAALLYNSHPPAWLVTVPGVDFHHGEGFSPEVCRLLADAPDIAERLLAKLEVVSNA